jgi:hypothetical protein
MGAGLCRHAGPAGLTGSLLADRATWLAAWWPVPRPWPPTLPLKLNIVVAIAAAVAVGWCWTMAPAKERAW